jgi:hypothetical protein
MCPFDHREDARLKKRRKALRFAPDLRSFGSARFLIKFTANEKEDAATAVAINSRSLRAEGRMSRVFVSAEWPQTST